MDSVFVDGSASAGCCPSAVSELTLCFNQVGDVRVWGTRASATAGSGLSGSRTEAQRQAYATRRRQRRLVRERLMVANGDGGREEAKPDQVMHL